MHRPAEHHWVSPEECAAMLGGTRHGKNWRAPCPGHGGSNPTALGIAEGRDRAGNPMTLLHCFAMQCRVEVICANMGIEVQNLFCVQPSYGRAYRHALRTKSPHMDRLRTMQDPSPDEIAQVLLEEMIVSDPEWIETCAPAQAKIRELAQASPRARAQLSQALTKAGFNPELFWETLGQNLPPG